jgi:hypothetical protein
MYVDLALDELAMQERQHLANEFVDIDGNVRLLPRLHQQTHSLNQLSGTLVGIRDVAQDSGHLSDVRRPAREVAQGRLSIGQNGCQGLVQLMR